MSNVFVWFSNFLIIVFILLGFGWSWFINNDRFIITILLGFFTTIVFFALLFFIPINLWIIVTFFWLIICGFNYIYNN